MPLPKKPRERLATIRGVALLIATLVGLYLCYLLALPFLSALVWALTISVLAAPFHRRLENKLKHPALSAAVSVALLALLVFLPLTLLGQYLVGVLSTGLTAAQQQLENGDWQRALQSHPLLSWIGTLTAGQDLATLLTNMGTWLTNLAAAIVRELVQNVLMLLLTFYLLFYFLRDRGEVLRQMKLLSPLTDDETDYVFVRVSDTIHGVFCGTVVTAAVQGTLGGLMFWVLGLPNPLFWGLVMSLLAVIPLLGTFVVWIPAAAYLAMSGEWGKAVILAVYGAVAIGGIDNILHPVLASGRLRLHTVPTFVSIVGGIMLFGASGLILGPLVVTTTIAILEIYRARATGGNPITGEKEAKDRPERVDKLRR